MPENEQNRGIEVAARRLGRGQRFELTAVDANGQADPRRWGVVQWACKPRRGQDVPYWYGEGLTWHLYDGDAPEKDKGGELPPPKGSFATMDDVKGHVRALVAGGPPAG